MAVSVEKFAAMLNSSDAGAGDAAAEPGVRRIADIAYGEESDAQCLDLYLPEKEGLDGPLPLVVFIHGGAWATGDKHDNQSLAWRRLARDGFAVASLNYRLTSAAAFPAGIDDCVDAICYLRKHADKYGLDAARVAVAGDSSGGHYALLLAQDPARVAELGIRCCVAWFPVTDLVAMAKVSLNEDGTPRLDSVGFKVLSAFLGHALTEADLPALSAASPMHNISDGAAPMLVQQGDADQLVPCLLTQAFAKRSGAELDVLPGADHLDLAFDTPQNMEKVRAFLSRWL